MNYDEWTDDELVDELCDIESGLSEWEIRFVESVAKRVNDSQPLTQTQRTKCVQILEVRTG